MSDQMAYGETPWYKRDVEKYRELAKEDPEQFLQKLENTGAVMFAAQMNVAAELLRESGMGVEPAPTKRRRRRRN